MYTFKELRDQLSDGQIKDILAQFNVEPVNETENFIVFPTCCHNLEGGSPKLFYYKNTKLFKCYTQCNEMFDIFTLLVKMYALRDQEITLRQAVSIAGLDNSDVPDVNKSYILEDLKYMNMLNTTSVPNTEELGLKTYDKKIVNTYLVTQEGCKPWIDEGIGWEQIIKFNIRYDVSNNAIIIPNYDYDGNLIGVRGRFLDPNAKAKYAPIWYNRQCLSHPTGKSLYGIYENHKTIEEKKMVILFEGEKSVLKFGTYYPNSNVALATLGKNITREHIQLLLKMGVKRVVLAYDADYETYDELEEKKKEYLKLATILTPYFNVSILLDYDLELSYKDSPVDKGKEVFDRILKERINI